MALCARVHFFEATSTITSRLQLKRVRLSPQWDTQPYSWLQISIDYSILPALTLSDSEYLGSTFWAYTLSCGFFILHLDLCRVFDFHLLPAFHAIGLHRSPPTFWTKGSLFLRRCQYSLPVLKPRLAVHSILTVAVRFVRNRKLTINPWYLLRYQKVDILDVMCV